MNDDENLFGIKNINIQVRGSYPVISAYEFEYLKELPEAQSLWKESTIYLIVQRPLMYFNNLHIVDGIIYFEIADMNNNKPLTGSLDPYKSGFIGNGESFYFNVQLYSRKNTIAQQFDYAAAFMIESKTREHLAWITPQKVIHLAVSNNAGYYISGDLEKYIDYKIHYIGQAFNQEIWARLTGHEKLQSILTREPILDNLTRRVSFEISLILLEITGVQEANIVPYHSWMMKDDTQPILHDLGDDNDFESFMKFHECKVSFNDQILTNEVEALLVSTFKPEYNKIKFNNYPDIKSGTRSLGYTESSLVIEYNPTTLETSHCKLNAIFCSNN